MRKLGVGLVSVGEMCMRHAENIRRLVPEARLIADVASERARQAAAELEIEHSYGNLEDMLECKDLDAVLIATPDKFHAQAVEVAARAGKDMARTSSVKSHVNGMIFYTNTIHDFDLALWLMQDEVSEVHAYTTSAIRPEVARLATWSQALSICDTRKAQLATSNRTRRLSTVTTSARRSSDQKAVVRKNSIQRFFNPM